VVEERLADAVCHPCPDENVVEAVAVHVAGGGDGSADLVERLARIDDV
jgi:hypothetical protein